MFKKRENEARSWEVAEADGDRAVAELKESLDRLRGQVGAFRDKVGDNDNTGEAPGERRKA